jgi:hypothetical protein
LLKTLEIAEIFNNQASIMHDHAEIKSVNHLCIIGFCLELLAGGAGPVPWLQVG